MNKNEKFVITLNRELGSGGRTVGCILAERLGVAFYDKALIDALKKKFNLSVDEIEKLKGQSHSWWAELKSFLFSSDPNAYANEGIIIVPPFNQIITLSASDAQQSYVKPTNKEMFDAETEILKGIGEEESCVIAGRSGFYVFRDHPNHLSVLIQASMPFRIKRVMFKQHMNEEEARQTIEKVDKMRENYVKEFTGTSRYDTRNYDLVISADGKSEEEMADLIMAYIG